MITRHRCAGIYLVGLYFLLNVLNDNRVNGHGRLMDPPSRNSMWRLGFPNPVNYNDNELFCGGYAVQWLQNKGQCGVCGDAYHLREPRPHEAGGEYAKGTIVRRYTVGQDIDVEVELTANHLGRFEMYLCPNDNPTKEATPECFQNYPLYVSGTQDVRFEIPEKEKKAILKYRVTLPRYVTCTQCVIQWTYYTGNMWGTCENGTEAVGCGMPETFRNCADVSIVTSTAGIRPPLMEQNNPFLLYYKQTSPPNIEYLHYYKKTSFSSNDFSHYYQETSSSNNDFSHYYQPAQSSNREYPHYYKPTSSVHYDFPLVVRSQICVPTYLYRYVPGMNDWCQSNCVRYPPHCPQSVCQCPEVCDAIGEIRGKEGASVYCMDKCLVYPSDCPHSRCRCY